MMTSEVATLSYYAFGGLGTSVEIFVLAGEQQLSSALRTTLWSGRLVVALVKYCRKNRVAILKLQTRSLKIQQLECHFPAFAHS